MPHYFEESTTAERAPVVTEWMLPDGALSITSDHGVFGYGKVDVGTKLLLVRGPQRPQGHHLLDLGCGTGALACAMARRAPAATVWAVDVNERARELCEHNALANGCTNVRVVAPDDLPTDIRFDHIWSNPPIRIGKAALHQLLLRWLDRLTPDGESWLTVQRHLGADSLHQWLNAQGFATTREVSAAGFRLLRSSPRRIDLDT